MATACLSSGQAIVSWLMAHSPRYPLLGTRVMAVPSCGQILNANSRHLPQRSPRFNRELRYEFRSFSECRSRRDHRLRESQHLVWRPLFWKSSRSVDVVSISLTEASQKAQTVATTQCPSQRRHPPATGLGSLYPTRAITACPASWVRGVAWIIPRCPLAGNRSPSG